MANKKRTIRGESYNIPEIVNAAIAFVDNTKLDTEKSRQTLQMLGYADPDPATIEKYARESAILNKLQRETGANFSNQIGKIDFSSTENAIAGVDSYLNRRNAGHRAAWSASHK